MIFCPWCGATGDNLDESVHHVKAYDHRGNFAHWYCVERMKQDNALMDAWMKLPLPECSSGPVEYLRG